MSVKPYYQDSAVTLFSGDALETLREMDAGSAQCCVTSPPYWGLRDYGTEGQLGLEPTPGAYVAAMVGVFREARRVLRDDGTLWLNLGDSYVSVPGGQSQGETGQMADRAVVRARAQVRDGKAAEGMGAPQRPPSVHGLKPKDLVGIPWRVAFALQAEGWWLRQDIIWSKPNPMPESVTDRCTKAHEYFFLLSKRERYYYDAQAIAEPCTTPDDGRVRVYGGINKGTELRDNGTTRKTGREVIGNPNETRNRRSVWTVATQPYAEAHFATFPPELIKPMILAGCPEQGVVLDPFSGSGTTLVVAKNLNRRAVGIELNPAYCALAVPRCAQEVLL